MPSYKTTLMLLGVECNVEVDYTIKTVGSPPSYSPMFGADGGDPDEIDILAIWIGDKDYLKELGNCIAFTGSRMGGWSVSHLAYPDADTVKYPNYNWQDPIQACIFGCKWAGKTTPKQIEVKYIDYTIYEVLEERILCSEALQDAIRDLDNQEW